MNNGKIRDSALQLFMKEAKYNTHKMLSSMILNIDVTFAQERLKYFKKLFFFQLYYLARITCSGHITYAYLVRL